MTDFTSSYVLSDTILEAYIGNDPRAAAIALKALAATSQEWYCQKATKAIDALNYQGYKLNETQDRQFPRKYQIPDDEIYPYGTVNILVDAYGFGYLSIDPPKDIIDACCEEAIAIYAFNTTSSNTDRENLRLQGVQSFSMGGIYSETLTNPTKNQNYGIRSQDAYDLLEQYIESAPFII